MDGTGAADGTGAVDGTDRHRTMRLIDALKLINGTARPEREAQCELVCGFTPLHLETFLKAHARLHRTPVHLSLSCGLFGDLPGNLERAIARRGSEAVLVLLEWQDLDPRLGHRHSGGFRLEARSDLLDQSARSLDRILALVRRGARSSRLILVPPTLPLPPIDHVPVARAGSVEIELRALLAGFLAQVSREARVVVASSETLARVSPADERLDIRSDLQAGFPYTRAHAARLAELLVDLILEPPPLKGLITDLDETLWSGILGEVGPEEIAWHLEDHAQIHGLYQQLLGGLADAGVLLAVASKNDPALVDRAFAREDLLVGKDRFFPLEASWSPKSASVAKILQAWNIAPDAVVFVDDNPLELAEVQRVFPDMTCLQFTPSDPSASWSLLWRLRALFGKGALSAEDGIRLASLRAAAVIDRAAKEVDDYEGFLASLSGRVRFDVTKSAHVERAFELLNKTNQFNLNGSRVSPAEWDALLRASDTFCLVVSYEDKFGSLGNIAVVTGLRNGRTASIDRWVMSCRAFARQIEYHTLDYIFSALDVRSVRLEHRATERNGPFADFLGSIAPETRPGVDGPVVVDREEFRSRCPGLVHATLTEDDD